MIPHFISLQHIPGREHCSRSHWVQTATVFSLGHPNGLPAAPYFCPASLQISQHRSQRDMLGPLTDHITALLKILEWFSSQCRSRAPYPGPGSLCHLTSRSTGDAIAYPIPSPNPTLWPPGSSEHARHTTFVCCSLRLECSFPLASACLPGFLQVSAQVVLGWFLWCWGSNLQSVACAS